MTASGRKRMVGFREIKWKYGRPAALAGYDRKRPIADIRATGEKKQ